MEEENEQLFSLRWNNHLRHMAGAFETLLEEQDFVDVTLSCDGKKIKAHKMLLSACSSYFKDLFKDNPCQHPVIIFRNVNYEDLSALVSFIYQGEVSIQQEQLASFLATAELLRVKGLTEGDYLRKQKYTVHDDDDDDDKPEDLAMPPPYMTPDTQSVPENLSSEISLTPLDAPQESPTPLIKKRRVESERQPPSPRARRHDTREIVPAPPLLFPTPYQSVEIIPVTPSVEDAAVRYKKENISSIEPSEYVMQSSRRKTKLQEAAEFYNGGMDEASINTESDTGQKMTAVGICSKETGQESIQGHWLSSLNGSNAVTTAGSVGESGNQKHRYVCSICGATYKHLRNLRAHCHLHYGKTRCNLCNKVLCNISYFKKHLQQQHGLLMDYSTKKQTI